MTNSEIKNSIRVAVNTLNAIELHGKNNLNYLLGAIIVLEKIESEIGNAEPVVEEDAHAEHPAE